MTEQRMTAAQAAEYLGVKPKRIYTLSSQGRLGQRDEDGYLYFTKRELDEYRAVTSPKGGRPTFLTRPKKELSSAAL